MTAPRRSVQSTLMIGAVVLSASAALVMPSVAQAATVPATTVPATTVPATTVPATTGTKELPARLQRACLRIPNLEIRTDKFVARLDGDASTRGSLLWLQGQIDDAKAKNRTQLVTVLENRLAVRTQTVAVLTHRQQTLTKLADLCRQHGVDV